MLLLGIIPQKVKVAMTQSVFHGFSFLCTSFVIEPFSIKFTGGTLDHTTIDDGRRNIVWLPPFRKLSELEMNYDEVSVTSPTKAYNEDIMRF